MWVVVPYLMYNIAYPAAERNIFIVFFVIYLYSILHFCIKSRQNPNISGADNKNILNLLQNRSNNTKIDGKRRNW